MHPLSGSPTWAQYDGTTVVRKIWNGKANLVELEVDGTQGHLELMSLRLYNPESSNGVSMSPAADSGASGAPTIGAFERRPRRIL